MRDKKARIKTTLAFGTVLIVVMVAWLLNQFDRSGDVFPNENTTINLYGEMHGYKEFYDIEFQEWKKFYGEGYRNLFIELPYFSAEFLNEWMKEDSDELIDKFFEEIKGSAGDNEYFYEFFHEIKEYCPETIFFGTDVGHLYNTTGVRYLRYLEENGLTDSEKYSLANENIQQGITYYESNDSTRRESYMVSNFINAYERCGGGKIMGIYGSYHTDFHNSDVMVVKLKEKYGDRMSAVRVKTIAFEQMDEPYDFGFCITGVVFLLMLFVPNIMWTRKGKPIGYVESAKKENKVLLMFERIGQVIVSTSLVIFPALNPKVMVLVDGLYFEWKIIIWMMALTLMILYECYWMKYFKSSKTMKDYYSSFMGFPLAGATLPVMAVLLLGIYSENVIVICSAIILGIGHIGIHYMHKKEIKRNMDKFMI